jgi:Tfp pilus assembly protein PilN
MSALDFLNRPIGGTGKKDKADASAPAEPKAPRGSGPRRERPVNPETVSRPGGSEIVVGGAPRVDLMPPEVRVKRSQLRTRRKLRLGLFAVIAVVLVACGGSFAWNAVTQASVVLAQVQQQELVKEQAGFGEVTKTSDAIALIEAGQRVGAGTEVQWGDYLTKLQAALPAGMSLTSVSISAASPVQAFDQPTAPLQGGRIASINLQVSSADLPSAAAMLEGFETLPGYADATPGQVIYGENGYVTSWTLHIGTAALSGRFQNSEK